MKTITKFLLPLVIVPVALSAQPSLTNNEFYHIGDVIRMVNCDATTVHAGASGPAVTWDFSRLTSLGGISSTQVLKDNSSIFLTSNILEIMPNGYKEDITENSTDTYINAIEDTVHGITYNYYNYDISKRPIIYNNVYIDSYRLVITSPSTVGTGHLTQTCDGYGTLILPTGTFNNVLRVKKLQTEVDTQSTTGNTYLYSTTVTYMWFDSLHNAPLLRMDSVVNSLNVINTVMYNAAPEAVPHLTAQQPGYTAYLDNSGLHFTGNFDYGVQYDLAMYNIIGTKIVNREFTGTGYPERFDVDLQLREGIYIVSIIQKNNSDSRTVIKLVKQM